MLYKPLRKSKKKLCVAYCSHVPVFCFFCQNKQQKVGDYENFNSER